MSDALASTPGDTLGRLISASVGRASDETRSQQPGRGLALKARRSEHGRYELTNARLSIWQPLTPVTFAEGDRLGIISFSRPGLNVCPCSESGYSARHGVTPAGFTHHESMSHATSSRGTHAARRPRTNSPRSVSTSRGGITAGTTSDAVEEERGRTCPPHDGDETGRDENPTTSVDSAPRQSARALAVAFFFSSVWYQYGTTTTTWMTRGVAGGTTVVPRRSSEEARGGAA